MTTLTDGMADFGAHAVHRLPEPSPARETDTPSAIVPLPEEN